MNRKLHNNVSALLATGTLFVLALTAQVSDSAPETAPAPVAVAVASVALAAPQAMAAHGPAASARSGRASRIRHSVAMPFFSFAPRG